MRTALAAARLGCGASEFGARPLSRLHINPASSASPSLDQRLDLEINCKYREALELHSWETAMDHSQMDHSAMDHGDMGWGPQQCTMNVRLHSYLLPISPPPLLSLRYSPR
jgi:hypothetical protein